MKLNTGTIDTTLLRNKTKKIVRLKRTEGQDDDTASWQNCVVALEKLVTAQSSLQIAGQEKRAAYIEELHMQVTAGIYKVDSMLLARSMLTDRTHFLDESQD
ncbi:MAG: hypothetical protein ACJ788_01955 [Ktedonobacteraceae bacterium]|jgi:anti-sigma28 factor (negative regulator of flagellin synthesis)